MINDLPTKIENYQNIIKRKSQEIRRRLTEIDDNLQLCNGDVEIYVRAQQDYAKLKKEAEEEDEYEEEDE